MTRPALALVLLAASIVSSAAPAHAVSSVHGGRAATVRISGLQNGSPAIGAGVIIKTDRDALTILTAKHVADLDDLAILTYDGKALRCIEKITISGYDLAIVRAGLSPPRMLLGSGLRGDLFVSANASSLSDYSPVKLGTALETAMAIHIWSYGPNAQSDLTRGRVLDTNPIFPDGPANGRFAITCAMCAPGMSGAGVFSDDGRLLGILSAGWKTSQGDLKMIEVEPLGPALFALR